VDSATGIREEGPCVLSENCVVFGTGVACMGMTRGPDEGTMSSGKMPQGPLRRLRFRHNDVSRCEAIEDSAQVEHAIGLRLMLPHEILHEPELVEEPPFQLRPRRGLAEFRRRRAMKEYVATREPMGAMQSP